MTALIIRLLIFVAIFVAIAWGARKIWSDWRGEFKAVDKARPDVITLKRDKDGKFRPPGDDGNS